jgi:7-carboxy-7-deazaguanine synthase
MTKEHQPEALRHDGDRSAPLGRALSLAPRERVKVSEIFYSLQGESTFSGLPCVLVRLVGCQMRCRWCDSEYAFHGGTWKSLDEVLDQVASFGCRMVELTGGEPLLQPGALPLLERLCDLQYRVLLETGGGLDITGVDPRVHRIVDVKCPGSGEHLANRWSNLDDLRPGDELKFVLADETDYLFARDLVRDRELDRVCPVHFSVVFDEISPRQVGEWILRDHLEVRLQLQLHKLLWGAQTRGV